MSGLTQMLDDIKVSWSEPRIAHHQERAVAVPLVCRFEAAATSNVLADVSSKFAVPPDLLDFWRFSNGASLFIDETYGQWGLRLLPATVAIEETKNFEVARSTDVRLGDLVVGKFLGDADVLLLRCDQTAEDYGSLVVALPLDERSDWDRIAPSLEGFLRAYARTHGEKFWT